MSGLGRIQRGIREAFLAYPNREFRTIELVSWCYPRLIGKPQLKHRCTIVRAAKMVARRVRRDRPGGVVFAARKKFVTAPKKTAKKRTIRTRRRQP